MEDQTTQPSPALDRVSLALRERIPLLEAMGFSPYAYHFARTHTTREAISVEARGEGGEGVEVAVAGRIVSLRRHGRSTFFHLEDRHGLLQIFLRQAELGEDYSVVELLRQGDHVGVRGGMMRTRTGEVTLQGSLLEILSVATRPLPFGENPLAERREESVGGFQEAGARARERHLDLIVNRDSRRVFQARSRIISALRRLLDERDFLEVETPVLQPTYGGAHARPFQTHHHALDEVLFLRISDELYLRRLIVGGLERVYEIGHDFRNEGVDRTHNPEFTMLECYQAYADYSDMLHLAEELVRAAARASGSPEQEERFRAPFQRLSFVESLRQGAGVEALDDSPERLRERLCALSGAGREEASAMNRAALLDGLFSLAVEPGLVAPTFVLDYPVELSPMARPHREDARLTERFELYLNGMEIANAYTEICDPEMQRERFQGQARAREGGDREALPYDAEYVEALRAGVPPCGGLGIGVDRLVMVMTGQSSIREVILFPAYRRTG